MAKNAVNHDDKIETDFKPVFSPFCCFLIISKNLVLKTERRSVLCVTAAGAGKRSFFYVWGFICF
jgi:hypothetical protein